MKTFYVVAAVLCVALYAFLGGNAFIVGGVAAAVGFFFHPRAALLHKARQFGVPFERNGIFNLKTLKLHRGPDYDVLLPLAQAQATLDELIEILLEDNFLVEGERVTFAFGGQRKIVNPYTTVILVKKLYDVDERYLAMLRLMRANREVSGA